jgi:hypothetical protein
MATNKDTSDVSGITALQKYSHQEHSLGPQDLISEVQTRRLLYALATVFSKESAPARDPGHMTFLLRKPEHLRDSQLMSDEEKEQLLQRFDLKPFLYRRNHPVDLVTTYLSATDPRIQNTPEGDDPYEPPLIVNEAVTNNSSIPLGLFELDRSIRTPIRPLGGDELMGETEKLIFYSHTAAELTDGELTVKTSILARLKQSINNNPDGLIEPWVMEYFTKSSGLGIPIYIPAEFFNAGITFHHLDKDHQQPAVDFKLSPIGWYHIDQTIHCWGLDGENALTVPLPNSPQTDFIFYSVNQHLDLAQTSQLLSDKSQ